MVRKAARIAGIVFLVLAPYSMVLSPFSPYESSHPFTDFLLASALLSGIIALVINRLWEDGKPPLIRLGCLFLLATGPVMAPPLMLGPPELGAALLQRVSEEHFRYGLLLLAVVLLGAGGINLHRQAGSRPGLVLLLVSVLLQWWDNGSSFFFSREMEDWISAGQSPETFAEAYPFHPWVRGFGRALVYAWVPLIGFRLFRQDWISRVAAWALAVFSGIGMVFFILFLTAGPAFYFPFLVPAIALAPAYWLGIALLVRKRQATAAGR